jgi:hypothetical protein
MTHDIRRDFIERVQKDNNMLRDKSIPAGFRQCERLEKVK